MQRGGKRIGAGRKKEQRTIQSEKFREYLIEEVIKEKAPIVKALIDKAKLGEILAIKEVLERVAGKVKEQVEIGGINDNPIEVSIVSMINKVYGEEKWQK